MASLASEDKPNFPFTFPSYDDWLEVAQQELEGADPIKKLIIRKAGLEIFPFYTASQEETEKNPILKPSSMPYGGARNWINTPKVLVTDDSKANEVALSYLNSGAEGILFDCTSTNIIPGILLNKISLPDCAVSFQVSQASAKWLTDFRHFAESNFDKKDLKGCLFWQTDEENFEDIISNFSHWPQFYSLGIVVDPYENVSDEIAQSLHRAVILVNELSEKKIEINSVLDQISFSVTVGTDFFLEIAKLKSLRNLWHQVKGAYNNTSTKHLHIHAISKAWNSPTFQQHGNMVKSTTSAMAAIAGGCDSLTVEPEDDNNDTMRRIATNVSSILREESHFSKVADPTAGSYYIESLTNQLSEKAWSKFQSLIK